MFTGLVEEIGRVVRLEKGERIVRLELQASALPARVHVGDSVAVAGVCLTVVHVESGHLAFEMVPETLERTHLGDLPPGKGVNLEAALEVGAPLGGHFVQGHVDGIGRVLRNEVTLDEEHILEISLDPSLTRYCVEKGSIALDGVSLTLTRAQQKVLAVALIPHTLEQTTLSSLRPDDPIHVEVDILAKYVERLLVAPPDPASS